jgi:hypothetical protein
MSLAGIIAAFVIAGVLGAWIMLPLLRRTTLSDAAFIDRQRERARAYYERVLTNIRDLDEDYTTGKISGEEYAEERENWVQRGVRLLRLLDELADQQNIVSDHDADDATIDAAIDAAIEDAVKSTRITSEAI